jgi:hypothetical protein
MQQGPNKYNTTTTTQHLQQQTCCFSSVVLACDLALSTVTNALIRDTRTTHNLKGNYVIDTTD